MFEDLSEKDKNYYLNIAKEVLRGTFVECKDCSIYGESGYFVSSYKDEKKLQEVAKKLYGFIKKP